MIISMKDKIATITKKANDSAKNIAAVILGLLFLKIALNWKPTEVTLISIIIAFIIVRVGWNTFRTAIGEFLHSWASKFGFSETTAKKACNDLLLGQPTEDISDDLSTSESVKPSEASESFPKVVLPLAFDSERLLDLGVEAFDKRNIDKSLMFLELAFYNDNRNWRAAQLLGALYLFKGKPDKSLEYSLSAIELDKDHFNQFMNAGIAYIWKKEEDKAIENLKIAINRIESDTTNQNRPDIKLEWGKCILFVGEALKNQGKKGESMVYVKKAIEKLEEIPTTDRDSRMKFWIKEANRRLMELKNQ